MTSISIPLPTSVSGKVPQRCPRAGCQPAEFLLGPQPGPRPGIDVAPPLRRTPGSPGMTCPYCGQDGPDDDFRHPEVASHVERRTAWELERFAAELVDDLLSPLEQSLRGLDGTGRGGVAFTESPRPSRPAPCATPPSDLLRNVACHVCGRAYGVFAIALFCPDCGAANLSTHVEREARLVADEIADSCSLVLKGEHERASRRLANAHEDVATAVEAHLKAVFGLVVRHRLTAAEADAVLMKVGNDFQNVDRARAQLSRFSFDPFGDLSAGDLSFFLVMMSKRHVVAHNLGIADAKYVDKVGDGKPGTNVALAPQDILRFVDLLRRIVRRCETQLPEFRPTRKNGE